jgi:histidyl-tRNA synthetase
MNHLEILNKKSEPVQNVKKKCFTINIVLIQDILAVGGRYDHLISEFSEKFSLVDESGCDPSTCAVGISISLDRLAAVISQDEMAAKFSSADVLLCSQVSIKS